MAAKGSSVCTDRSTPTEVTADGPSNRLLSHPMLVVFLIALVVRLAAILFIHVGVGADAFGVTDDQTYSYLAEEMAAGRAESWDPYAKDLYNRTATFVVPLTLIQLVFGSVELGGPVLAAWFGALTAALVTGLALRLMSPAWAVAGGLVVALFPSQVLWSSLTLKDSAVWAVLAGLALAVAAANRTRGRRLLVAGLVIALVLLLVGHLRPHTFIVASWAAALAAFLSERGTRLARVLMTSGMAIALPWLLGFGPLGLAFVLGQDLDHQRSANAFGAATAFVPTAPQEEPEKAAEIEALTTEVEETGSQLEKVRTVAQELKVEEHQTERRRRKLLLLKRRQQRLEREHQLALERLGRIEATSRPGPELPGQPEDEVLSPTLMHLPKGLSVMLLEPYPWASTDNSRVRMARLESLIWYPLVALAIIGLVGSIRSGTSRSILAFPILVGGGVLAVYALAEGNFGTAYRHRGEFVWVIALLAVAGARTVTYRFRS